MREIYTGEEAAAPLTKRQIKTYDAPVARERKGRSTSCPTNPRKPSDISENKFAATLGIDLFSLGEREVMDVLWVSGFIRLLTQKKEEKILQWNRNNVYVLFSYSGHINSHFFHLLLLQFLYQYI